MRFNKTITALTVCALTGVLLAGCSSKNNSGGGVTSTPSAPNATQIAFVTNNASDYWLIAKAGVEKAAGELGPSYNVKFIIPSDGTAATQKQEVSDQIATGVKAIAISPVDPTNQTPWIDQISAQVPVVTQDSDAPQSKRLAYLGTDNHAAGVMVGNLIKKALPNGGKIMLFVGDRSAQNAHDREMGIRDALKGTKVDILDVRTDNADHATAKTNAADAMTAHPDLAMEVGLWSYNGPAILSAVQDAHMVGKMKIICFDQEKGTLAGIKSGAIIASVVQQPYQFGYAATKLLAQLAKGDKSGLPKGGVEYFPAQVIDSSNINSYISTLEKQTGKSWSQS